MFPVNTNCTAPSPEADAVLVKDDERNGPGRMEFFKQANSLSAVRFNFTGTDYTTLTRFFGNGWFGQSRNREQVIYLTYSLAADLLQFALSNGYRRN